MVLTVTLSPCLDVEVSVPVVEPERKLRCTDQHVAPGGGGLNVARVVSRFGGPTLAAFPIGGEPGRRVRERMEAEGVPCETITTAQATRENLIIRETSTGHQFRFMLAAPSLSGDELRSLSSVVRHHARFHRHVVLSGSVPDGVDRSYLVSLIDAIHRAGAEAIVDTSGPALLDAARAGALLLKPSRRELSDATGRTLSTNAEVVDAARLLLAAGSTQAILVSLANQGALLVERGSVVRFGAAPVEVRSSVGAGDSMVAGVVVALERGESLEAAARFGVACGTATVTRRGSALCRPRDVAEVVSLVTTDLTEAIMFGR